MCVFKAVVFSRELQYFIIIIVFLIVMIIVFIIVFSNVIFSGRWCYFY